MGKIKNMIWLCSLLVICTVNISWSGELKNGGFETFMPINPGSHIYDSMVKRNWEFSPPLAAPNLWVPNAVIENGMFKLIKDKTKAHSGDVCIQIRGHIYQNLGAVSENDKLSITLWAKDPEKGEFTIRLYLYDWREDGSPVFIDKDCEVFKAKATPEWAKYSIEIAMKEIPFCREICFVLVGNNTYFDDVEAKIIPGGDSF